MGTVLAVLAIYVFTLLAPLHHAAATQRDFAALGYAALSDWSVCVPLSEDHGHGSSQALGLVKCAAASVGKDEAVVPPLPVPVGAIERSAEPILYGRLAADAPSAIAPHMGQARAPPVMV